MQRIYKYPLQVTDVQMVQMPIGAVILTAQNQNEVVTLWAMVEDKELIEFRAIHIFGTGHPIPEKYNGKYIATVQAEGFVWHIFEPNKE